LKDTVKRNYALFITAIFSLTDRYIYYGNEVKPYMSDNLYCLITLLLWQKYKLKKINLLQLAIAYSVIIWFSFSAVFFVAACMIIECFQLFVEMVKNKDLSVIKKLCICLIVLVSFVINYVLWLSKTSDNAGGANYWALLRFPLIPMSLSDIKLVIKMALQFWNFYTYYIVAIFIFLLLIYFVICIKNKEDKSNLVVPFILSLLILFVASYLGFYPIQDRLVQVYAIVALVIVGYSCNDMDLSRQNNDMIYEIDWIKLFYYGLLTGCLAIVGMGGCKNLFANHVYKSGSEVSESMEYIEENMTDTDMLYVFRYSIPVYTYETGYQISYTDLKSISEDKKNTNKSLILPCQIGNTIYGQSLVTYFYQTAYSYENENNMTAILEDAELISKNDSVYIFASHGEAGLSGLLEELEKYGTIEMVVDYYNTHLYHFVRSNA
jgi:hypothetical protein